MKTIDIFYLAQPEPFQATLLALSEHILSLDKNITSALKYGMPFFSYKGKRFCYLWIDKKRRQPYIGFVEGKLLHQPFLIQEDRKRMKIFLIDTEKDLPLGKIDDLIKQALSIAGKFIN